MLHMALLAAWSLGTCSHYAYLTYEASMAYVMLSAINWCYIQDKQAYPDDVSNGWVYRLDRPWWRH